MASIVSYTAGATDNPIIINRTNHSMTSHARSHQDHPSCLRTPPRLIRLSSIISLSLFLRIPLFLCPPPSLSPCLSPSFPCSWGLSINRSHSLTLLFLSAYFHPSLSLSLTLSSHLSSSQSNTLSLLPSPLLLM